MMKRLLLPLVLFSLHCTAATTTYWAKGVNADSGWHDADKSMQNDTKLCWAAAAANLIAWWQDLHPHVESESPKGIDEVWAKFRASFQDGGGETLHSLRWWFSGGNLPGAMRRTEEGQKAGNYYSEMMRNYLDTGHSFPGTDLIQEEPKTNMSERLKELLTSGYGIGIGIRRIDENKKILPHWHMLSLWGIDYDDKKQCVTRVYLTDSDDVLPNISQSQKGLFSADVTTHEMVNDKGQPFTGLVLRNEAGWFRDNAVITTLIALNADFGAEAVVPKLKKSSAKKGADKKSTDKKKAEAKEKKEAAKKAKKQKKNARK